MKYIYKYLFLLTLRLLSSLLPGYIHPDEYFQSAEITAGDTLDLEVFIPWEYNADHPARCILIPYLTTGVPFLLLRYALRFQRILGHTLTLPTALFTIERLVFFFLSLILDSCVKALCVIHNRDYKLSLLLLSTSYVALIYHTRPFSNSLESVLLVTACFLFFKSHERKGNSWHEFLLGAVFAIGAFCRITFVLYGTPIGAAFLLTTFGQVTKEKSWTFKLGVSLKALWPFLLGFFIMSTFCVLSDSFYFGHLRIFLGHQNILSIHDFFPIILNPFVWSNLSIKGSLVFTPLENLLYNLNAENLAGHGIHPRYLHLLVNLPLLFGPVAFIAVYDLMSGLRKMRTISINANIDIIILASIAITGTLLLSIMPHQEPRFLLPLLVPITMGVAWKRESLSKKFWILWISFNLICTFMFGVLHQGGLTPTLQYLHSISVGIHSCIPGPDSLQQSCEVGGWVDYSSIVPVMSSRYITALHFHKTYMPPRHLLTYPKSWRNGSILVNVLDHAGDKQSVSRALENSVAIVGGDSQEKAVFQLKNSSAEVYEYERTLLIAPATATLPSSVGIHGHSLIPIYWHFPNLNFDDIDVVAARVVENWRREGLQSVVKGLQKDMSIVVYLLVEGGIEKVGDEKIGV